MPRDHDLPPGPSAAAAQYPDTKRPFIAAPPSMFSYMWMIPVVPPVPPYLLVPNMEPAVPPAMHAAHYPPGWDVGVLSNEWTDEDTFEDDATSSDDGLGAEATCEAERHPEKRRKGFSHAERPQEGPVERDEPPTWRTEGAAQFAEVSWLKKIILYIQVNIKLDALTLDLSECIFLFYMFRSLFELMV